MMSHLAGTRMVTELPYDYDVYGVTLQSNMRLTLPKARARAPKRVVAIVNVEDLDFNPGETAPVSDQWAQQIVLGDRRLYMSWRGWFDFLISSDGRHVSCRNRCDRSLEYLEAYLTNYAVSAALLQQGEETLHATAVDIGGRVVGLLGASGAGKSTLASFLRTTGGSIVTDDILRIGVEKDAVVVYPGPNRLKLFAETAARFLPGAAPAGRWSPVRDKLVFDLGDPPDRTASRRLCALYHLRAPDAKGEQCIRLTRLRGLELFNTIGGSTMNNAVDAPGRPGRHFRFVAQLSKMVPTFALSYPRRFDLFDDVAEAIFRSAPA